MANDKRYIHEFVEITGHNRARYMHHMTANWSPEGQEQRSQLCFGVWAVLGSTGRWPEVVNIWEHDGWQGLASSFEVEAVGRGAQDPTLEAWWATAADLRRGGFDRILEPAPWTRTIEELCADGVRGACYAHELVSVAPGAARDFLDRVRAELDPVRERYGWQLVGAWTTAMRHDDECILLWAIPTWSDWAAYEDGHSSDGDIVGWLAKSRDVVEEWHRILLVDAPLSPLRTGRQPSRDDRVDDWDA